MPSGIVRVRVSQEKLLTDIRKRIMELANEVYDPNANEGTIFAKMERAGMTRALDIIEDEFQRKRVVR